MSEISIKQADEGEEEYGELLKFTLAGFAGGLIAVASILDWFGFHCGTGHC